MRWSPVVALVVLSSCVGQVAHDDAIDFGDVLVGESVERAFVLRNEGNARAEIELSLDAPHFSVEPTTIGVAPGSTATVTVRFSPSERSDVTGTLNGRFGSASSMVSLRGRGVAPELKVATDSLSFGVVALPSNGPAAAVVRTLRIENAGPGGVVIPELTTDGGALCIGAHIANACVPWVPVELSAGQSVDVPISLLATSPGAKRWVVNVKSGEQHASVTATAVVERFGPCDLTISVPEISVTGSSTLTVTHHGSMPCRVDAATLNATDASEFAPPLRLPHTLQPNEPWTFDVRLTQTAGVGLVLINLHLDVFEGVDGFAGFLIGSSKAACLTTSHSELQLGDVGLACQSQRRHITVYNVCPFEVTFDAVNSTGSGFSWSGLPSVGSTVPGPIGQQPSAIQFSVEFTAGALGAQSGAVTLGVEGRTLTIPVSAVGIARERLSANYGVSQKVTSELLLAIDSSPSFVSRRPEVRSRLAGLMQSLRFTNCADIRISIVPAEGDGGAQIVANDAGVTTFSAWADGGLEGLQSAFDLLPVGSETESCVDAVAAVASTADAGLAVYCVTDANEHAPNLAQKIASIAQRRSRLRWHTVGPFGTDTCGWEAPDDGAHDVPITATYGSKAGVCDADWWPGYGSYGENCEQRAFHLIERPDVSAPITVAEDGQRIPEGPTTWQFDATLNAVVFVEHPQARYVQIEFQRTCR